MYDTSVDKEFTIGAGRCLYGALLPPIATGDILTLSNEQTDSLSLDWLQNLVTDDIDAAPDAEHIAPITEGIDALIKQSISTNDFNFVNMFLTIVEPRQMRVDVMVAVLRSLFQIRSFLQDFRGKREAVREELMRRGMNADKILRGLG